MLLDVKKIGLKLYGLKFYYNYDFIWIIILIILNLFIVILMYSKIGNIK